MHAKNVAQFERAVCGRAVADLRIIFERFSKAIFEFRFAIHVCMCMYTSFIGS